MQASCRGLANLALNVASWLRLAWSRTPAIIITNSAFGIELKALGVYGTCSGPDSGSVWDGSLSMSMGWWGESLSMSIAMGLTAPCPSQSNMEVSKSF